VAGTCISLDASCPNGVVGRAPFACGVIDDGLSFSFGGDSYYQQDTVNRLCWDDRAGVGARVRARSRVP